jgi:hypothetical protein
MKIPCQKECGQFLHCCHSSRCAHCFHRIFILKYLQRAFRDKIFDTEIVATLGRALGDEDSMMSEAVWSISSLLP